MKLRKAATPDQTLVESILLQAAKRIKQTGSLQWEHLLTTIQEENIEEKIFLEEVILAEEAGKIAGVFYLSQRASSWDCHLWQNNLTEHQTFYLHKLALADEFVGQGLAKEILFLTQEMLGESPLKTNLRLDCISTQPYLNQLYPKSGFHLIGVSPRVQAGNLKASFNLYQWKNY